MMAQRRPGGKSGIDDYNSRPAVVGPLPDQTREIEKAVKSGDREIEKP
jgi:hypothetical protein